VEARYHESTSAIYFCLPALWIDSLSFARCMTLQIKGVARRVVFHHSKAEVETKNDSKTFSTLKGRLPF